MPQILKGRDWTIGESMPPAAQAHTHCLARVNGPVPPRPLSNMPESIVPDMVPVSDPPAWPVVGSLVARVNEPLAVTEPVTDCVWLLVLPFSSGHDCSAE